MTSDSFGAGQPLRRALLRLALLPGLLGSQALAQPTAGTTERDAAALPFALNTPVSCGEAALRVRQIDRMMAFYRDAIGLSVLHRTADSATLGIGQVPLLHLLSRPDATWEPSTQAGLFHIAFLMPSRLDLARWLLHAAINRIPLTGFADHSVSEAIYLNDPEGNGIEIYSDRPRERWQWNGDVVTMGTHPLDVDDILAMARDRGFTYAGAPAALRIGHMHLRVGSIATGRRFYQHKLGLASTRGDNARAAFLASGGYHHHVAINTWGSTGAGPRSEASTGLDWFSLNVRDRGLLDAQMARFRDEGLAVQEIEAGFQISDPWGTNLRLLGT